MLHEISPNQFNNQFQPNAKMKDEDFVLHYMENTLLLKTAHDQIAFPRKKDLLEIPENTESIFLFTYNDIRCFLIWDKPRVDESTFTYSDLDFFRTTLQAEIAWISMVGFHIKNWYTQHKYCGKCGGKTTHKPDERALICSNCGFVMYPTISPAIIVAITCNDKILLARGSKFKTNRFALIAGFVDFGETLEEAVIREVKEEVGLDVTNIRFYKNQPWPFSGSMMIGFVADADDSQPIVLDENEIAEAAWFKRGDLPNYPPTVSISGELIHKFETGEI